MTASGFLALYPEFTSAGTTLIGIVIAEVDLLISDSWGAKRDVILALSVAERLADSPQGRNARLDTKRNIYSERLRALKQAHAVSANRIG